MSVGRESLQDGCATWERFPYTHMTDKLHVCCLASSIFGQCKVMKDFMTDSSYPVMTDSLHSYDKFLSWKNV
jgi:hypothetical protein